MPWTCVLMHMHTYVQRQDTAVVVIRVVAPYHLV